MPRKDDGARVVVCAVGGLAVLLAAGLATAAPAAGDVLPPAALELQNRYAGVQVLTHDSRVTAIYGAPMTTAQTPDQAAAWWLEDHGAAFGVDDLELRLADSHEVSFGRFTVFGYEQRMDGLPVENGIARILVLNGNPNAVVYAAGKLAQPPAGGFQPDAATAEAALAGVQAMKDYAHLPQWSQPELVIFYDDGEGNIIPAVRAWKFRGVQPNLDNFESYTFFVDAAIGRLLHARNEVYHVDVTGHVNGMATPGTRPDVAGNSPQSTNLPDLRVRISGGNTAYSDRNGDFVIPNPGTGSVTVLADLIGRWATVTNNGAATLQLTQNVVPPGPANFLFNPTPSELNTSQVNGFNHTTSTHNFYKDRAPAYTGLDIALTCNTNLNQTCNAYFTTSPLSINFFRSGGGCVNSAYSSVVAHEYGHFIVWAQNLAQGAFGEGYGDSVAILQYDDGIVGRDFQGTGGHIRNIPAANRQYPCSGEVHFCGELLAGVWWDIKLQLQATQGTQLGLDMTRQLFVDWSDITLGGQSTNSAYPATAVEVLTVDDDDGNLQNGTPHYPEICAGFSAHNIQCPAVALALFEYPNGLPEIVTPNQMTTIRVNVVAVTQQPVPGTGQVSYRINGGQFTTVPMNELLPNQYEALLPAVSCLDEIDFYFSAQVSGGQIIRDPPNAPASTFTATGATGLSTVLDDNFEQDRGWTVQNINLQTGAWVRAVPAGNGGARGDPRTDFDGSGRCYVTGNGFDEDVDGGPTILTSPTLDMSGSGRHVLDYARWFYSPNGIIDFLTVEFSNNNGASWVPVENITAQGGWVPRRWNVEDLIAPTATMKLRFTTSDNPNDSVTEAGVDAVKVSLLECDTTCGDFDGDGDVDLTDFTQFQLCFGGSNVPPAPTCPPGVDADCDGDGDVDLADFLIFQNNFTGSL